MKTFEEFLDFGNTNNKIVRDLINYVKNNDIEKKVDINLYSQSVTVEFSIRNSERNLEIDPFEEEIGENDKVIKLIWNIYGYILTINEERIRDCSQKILNKLSKCLDRKH